MMSFWYNVTQKIKILKFIVQKIIGQVYLDIKNIASLVFFVLLSEYV